MSPPASPALAESWLELPDGKLFWLEARCAIGRLPDNDLVLDAPSLSRRHAVLAADAAGYTLSDLHSRNGTYLNGAAVTHPVVVRDADEIRIGDVKLRFRCTRQFEPASAPAGFEPTVRLDQVSERTCWLLLIDVVGFAALNESLGSEPALRRMQTWIAGMRPLVEGHGGRINGYLGDAIFAYWLCESATPDATLAALRAIEAWRTGSPLAFRVVGPLDNEIGNEIGSVTCGIATRSCPREEPAGRSRRPVPWLRSRWPRLRPRRAGDWSARTGRSN